MPPDVREWLPEDHFAWFVLDAVEAMDLDAFYGAYRVDGRARPAYEPAMMVALILYAYARGTRSSRAIERACIEDVAYRVIAAQHKPDHATIARFVERHQDALAEVFGVGARAVREGRPGRGERRRGRWQQDRGEREPRGQPSTTSVSRARSIEDGRAVDAEEDERFGDRRGDELPPELATSIGRQEWFKAARRWLDDERAEQAAPIARDRPERVREAKRRMDEQLFDGDARRGGLPALPGPRQGPPRRAARPEHGPASPTWRRRCRPGRSTPPTRIRGWSRASTGCCRATTRRPPATSTRS